MTVEYTPTSNRVNRVKDSAVSPNWRVYSHDVRGNVTGDGIHTFTYDYANQPITIAGADSGTYAYDGNLKRVKQIVGGQTIYSIYDRAGALLTRDNATTNAKTDYLAIAGQTFVRIRNNVASYPLNDHLGTPLAVAAQNGTIPANQTFNTTPFGEAWGTYSPGASNEQGYTGHIEDATGLTYMQARYYDPVMGRFLSTDPVGYLDQLNLYAYVHNDPVNTTDPFGMYGRGYGFTDDQWARYDKTQQKAANDMEKRAGKLNKKADKLDAKGKSGGDALRSKADALNNGVIALRSDGSEESGGFIANAVDQVSYEELGGSPDGAAAVVPNNRQTVIINIGNSVWNSSGTKARWSIGHESLHSTGVEGHQRGPNGEIAYKLGTPKQRAAFEALKGTPQSLLNPDHLMDEVY